MAIEFCSVSGYNEVGKNMSAVRVDDDAVILDMGFYVQKLADYEESNGNRAGLSREQMIELQCIPDDRCVNSWSSKVKAIVCSHAHLDHVGAVPYLAQKYRAPVLATPYTIEVLKNQLLEDEIKLGNPLKRLNAGASHKAGKLNVELIHVTHSVPQTAMIAVHTPKGVVLYSNDYKLDNTPVLGSIPDYKRLKQLGSEGVLALVADSLYSGTYQKTPSEIVAREMVREALCDLKNSDSAILFTCFASHIARLKSVVEFGQQINRKVVFFGRSLSKYAEAARNVGIIDFSKTVEICGYGGDIKRKLQKVEKDGTRGEYVFVCTGGQGEPRSVLSKMLNNVLPFTFKRDDAVIFSNRTIPIEPNIGNREVLERKFRQLGVRIFKDLHTSGHGAREDLRELIKLTNPQHIIPSHGDNTLVSPAIDLAIEMGYAKNRLHLLTNCQKITLE